MISRRKASRALGVAWPTIWAGNCAPSSSALKRLRLGAEVARVADTVSLADQAELAEYQPETCLKALVSLCGDLAPRAVLLCQ